MASSPEPSASSPAAPASTGKKFALALGVTLLMLLAAEVFCRVQAHQANQKSIDVAFDSEKLNDPNRRVAMIDIVQMIPNDRIIFELKPNMRDVLFKGAPFSTNSHGFRGPEMPVEEGPDTITIVGIGDSVMFGYGVKDGADYMAQLERMLNVKYPEKTWRCVNTGVPAYNTVMEVETLAAKGLAFGPDLVIIGIVSNDLVLPPYIRVVDDVFDLSRSFLWERLAQSHDPGGHRDGADPAVAVGADGEDGADGEAGQRAMPERDEDWRGFRAEAGRDARLLAHRSFGPNYRVPDRYQALVGWPPFRQALADLKRMSEEHGFLVTSFTNTEDATTVKMIEEARKMGWLHVRLFPEIQAFLKQHGGGFFSMEDPEAYLASKLAVDPNDGHPSALQHRMAATKLLEELEQHGIIEQLMR